MMRVTLNLGDFDSAQNEIPPPQQLISNVNPLANGEGDGLSRSGGGFSVTDCDDPGLTRPGSYQ